MMVLSTNTCCALNSTRSRAGPARTSQDGFQEKIMHVAQKAKQELVSAAKGAPFGDKWLTNPSRRVWNTRNVIIK